jgi:hypothetical protein
MALRFVALKLITLRNKLRGLTSSATPFKIIGLYFITIENASFKRS